MDIGISLEHPDISHAIRTGYPRGQAPQTALPCGRNVRVDDNAFPYVPDEREEN